MSKNYMIAILKKEASKPVVIKISKNLKSIEKIIGNELEVKEYENVLLIFNKNQKDETLKENTIFDDIKVRGNVMIVGNIKSTGDIRSLNKRELLHYSQKMDIRNNELEKEL